MTDRKLEVLKKEYPSVEEPTLLEILLSCDGSVPASRSLINCSLPTARQKRKIGALYQTSITSLLAPVDEKKIRRTPLGQKVITLNGVEDVEQHLAPYVSFHKSFLPQELSERILKYLLTQKQKMSPNEFYLFDNLCKANHSLGLFCTEDVKEAYENLIYNGKRSKPNFYNGDFEEVSEFVKNFMNDKVIPKVSRLPFQSKERWDCDVCIVNYYESLSNNLDWHSDRMSHNGPHNFIASLSLGTTREFRLRRNYSDNSEPSQIYSIIVPHNSMVIMKPGCQEEFKHSVNPMRGALQINPIVGSSRFNLTFRFYPLLFIQNLCRCNCNLTMTLRRSFNNVENRGKYFWTCENKYLNKDCGCFYWADFGNVKGNFIAKNEDEASSWVAPDDFARLAYLNEHK